MAELNGSALAAGVATRAYAPPHAAGATPVRSRYVLGVLFLIGVFNAMDRGILGVLLEPIRTEFGASDAAMGLLTGFAFVLFYALAGLPVARLADVYSRRTIISIGLAFWSLMTALAGLAGSLWQLAATRVGVGLGEASYLPAGMSILSDHFPSERRTLPLSVFALAFPVGGMMSLMVGGWLGQTVGWRMTLVFMGLPGILLAGLVRWTIREPTRGASEPTAADATLYDLRATFAYLWSLRSFRHLVAGTALFMLAFQSLGVWGPAFVMRVHGLDLAHAGATLGAASGLGGSFGMLLGGLITQRLARRNPGWLLGAPAATMLCFLPFALLFLFLPQASTAGPMFFGVSLFGAAMVGPAMATAQGLARVRMRSLAAALVSLTVSLFGLGLGPLVVGAASDLFAPSVGEASLQYALLGTSLAAVWGSAHFALGSRHLASDLGRAQGS